MPTSDFSSIEAIMHAVHCTKPRTICDIGIGCGKYGQLFRECLDMDHGAEWHGSLYRGNLIVDGVEGYERYVTPIHRALYDRIFIGDIRAMAEQLENYDLFTMIDVIEHLSIEDGTRVLRTLQSKARLGVLVNAPIRPQPQKTLLGNKLEEHISTWTAKDWRGFERARFRPIRDKWLVFLEGREGTAPAWLRMPRLRRRIKLAALRAFDALWPGRLDVPFI